MASNVIIWVVYAEKKPRILTAYTKINDLTLGQKRFVLALAN
jgi:hypothetical protein